MEKKDHAVISRFVIALTLASGIDEVRRLNQIVGGLYLQNIIHEGMLSKTK